MFDFAIDRHMSWVSSAAVTPVRAHLSHTIFDAHGREVTAAEFDDTSLRVASGGSFRWTNGSILGQAVLGKEWLSRLPEQLTKDFRLPYVGVEGALTLEALRSEEPLLARIDGARVKLRGAGLGGARKWIDADATVSLGRRWGPLFLRFEGAAFHVSYEHPATAVTVGGSWDILGGWALMGHPLGAFRLQSGASATAGADVTLIAPFELGVRASVLYGAAERHDGVAVLAQGGASGLHFFGGAGWPDVSAARFDATRMAVFCGLSGALFFLP